ncbi:hypothetical protein LUZ61_010884 [Rhynchospora tenuis]|uniref:Glycolipid transfer protein domain-containing protein n=1 Tax=Rhynchospora tenuis TaxID=198213 RepID=A0AAD5ZZZ1_9POAL|nr:hypothetical protein LUZ61_010884 [Rhynchospora tenuis]
MAGDGEERVLQKMAAAFEPLAEWVVSGGVAMELRPFAQACAQVVDLIEASNSIATLNDMIELDIQHGSVRQLGSHTRNLLRVKRGLELIKTLFEEIIKLQGNSLRNAASVAYDKVMALHHGQDIRKAVDAAMHAVPPKSQLFELLNEDEDSAKVKMLRFIRACGPVIEYIEELFISTQLGIDW